MIRNAFFVCQSCGNAKKFKVFTGNFQVIEQSPELGIRINKSSVLPNLRQNDNYVECLLCLKKSEYERAAAVGKKYVQIMQRLKGNIYKELHRVVSSK